MSEHFDCYTKCLGHPFLTVQNPFPAHFPDNKHPPPRLNVDWNAEDPATSRTNIGKGAGGPRRLWRGLSEIFQHKFFI